MATQHPDNAYAPYWHSGSKFVDTKSEVEECYRSFADLGCGEYMWDWEGKHVDEAVMERLLEKHGKFFKKHEIGKDVFLTFRIPNFWLEEGYRVARAFVNIVSANDLAADRGLHSPPVFEAILPMTTSGVQMHFIRKKYGELASALKDFGEAGPADIEIIPLVEEPAKMLEADKLLEQYLQLCKRDEKIKKIKIGYLRPFVARSDPALNSGCAAATLAAKACLSKCFEFELKTGVSVFPIIGAGCLEFRGGLRPGSIGEFGKLYEGVRTITAQPSFRYDHPFAEVKRAIAGAPRALNKTPQMLSSGETVRVKKLVEIFEKHYKKTVEAVADDINLMAKRVPSRRERRLHIGLYGYSRKVGKKKLPRAIAFAASMYSLGVPPELVGLGRALQEAKGRKLLLDEDGEMDWIGRMAANSGKFLCKQNLGRLVGARGAWKAVLKDVHIIEKKIGDLGPENTGQARHVELAEKALKMAFKKQDATRIVEKMAELRHSLG